MLLLVLSHVLKTMPLFGHLMAIGYQALLLVSKKTTSKIRLKIGKERKRDREKE